MKQLTHYLVKLSNTILFFTVSLLAICACNRKEEIEEPQYHKLTVTVKYEGGKENLAGVNFSAEPQVNTPKYENGVYRFSNLKQMQYNITASLTGCIDSTFTVDIQNFEEAREFRLRKKPTETGSIWGTIYYGGVHTPADSIRVTMSRGKETYVSKFTTNTGEYRVPDLPVGEYILTVSSWGIDTVKQPFTIPTIKNPYDIDVKKTILKPQIYYNGQLIDYTYDMGESPSYNFDILNDNRDTMHWFVEKSNDEWLTVSPSKGELPPGKQGHGFMITITDRTKLLCDTPPAAITINSNNGSKPLKVLPPKNGCEPQKPEKAEITNYTNQSEIQNDCPSPSVKLMANAKGADSFQWYNDGKPISGETRNVYEVKTVGSNLYSVKGKNAQGYGDESEKKKVTIIACPSLPSQASISPAGSTITNTCPDTFVWLTASASGKIDYYTWENESNETIFTGNPLKVTQSGVYHAIAHNISGTGLESASKTVAITSCIPNNPTNIKVNEFIYSTGGSKIKLSWNTVAYATQYKIQFCDNPEMNGCGYNYTSPTTSSYQDFSSSDFPCGKKYFRIIAINSLGEESSGTPYSYTMPVSITAPYDLNIRYNSATQAYMLDYIAADVKWYEGPIYFEIQRKEDNGSWQIIDTITGNTNEDLTTWRKYPDYTYSRDAKVVAYRVRAYISTPCGVYDVYSY